MLTPHVKASLLIHALLYVTIICIEWQVHGIHYLILVILLAMI